MQEQKKRKKNSRLDSLFSIPPRLAPLPCGLSPFLASLFFSHSPQWSAKVRPSLANEPVVAPLEAFLEVGNEVEVLSREFKLDRPVEWTNSGSACLEATFSGALSSSSHLSHAEAAVVYA